MNRIYYRFFLILVFVSFVSENILISETVDKGNILSKLISERKNKSYFTEFSIFNQNSNKTLSRLNEFVKKVDIYSINQEQLHDLYNVSPNDIIIKISSKENGLFELELTKMNFAPDILNLQLRNGENISNQNFKTGIAYSGIIRGDNNSFASLTVFDNCVLGLICNDKGNFVLGPKKDNNNRFSDDYIFYNDRDLIAEFNFKCDADDYSPLIQKGLELRSALKHGHASLSAGPSDSIRVKFTTDYQMYLDNGNNSSQVAIFVNAVFNNTATIYTLEEIPTRLAPSMSIYTSQDPYMNLNNSYQILNLFGSNTQDNFNGDLAHLLSTGHNQQLGGIAWINVLCQPYVYFPPPDDAHYGRFAFSNIENNYLPYPAYSWTVDVITHEMGHNVASRHTHACVWPTISGQIDSCYTSEGGCVSVTQPNYNGTIMSYCHLNGAINLSRRFGELPGDTIRLGYQYALCLDTMLNSSEAPLAYDLLQNYPNPFNPGTKISFALPEDGYVTLKVYDITGREVTTIEYNKYYEAGVFSSSFNAAEFNLASGVYLYKIDVRKNNNSVYSQIKKMVFVK